MNALAFKTRAEQKLEWLESLGRPLTDEESDQLRRTLHAVYCLPRNRAARAARMEAEMGAAVLAEHERGNAEMLEQVLLEARG